MSHQKMLSQPRSLLSHHSAPQSVLNQLAIQEAFTQGDGSVLSNSKPLGREELQGWAQHAGGRLGAASEVPGGDYGAGEHILFLNLAKAAHHSQKLCDAMDC